LIKLKERVERFGIKLAMVPLPLSSSPIRAAENPHIFCWARARSAIARSTRSVR
jgi:hypothetical protein